VVAGMREAVWALQPDLPIQDITTMRQRVSDSLATPRFLSLLLGVFAGVALLLACGGIYGSMLYSVSQRQREMGIRLALGADGGSVIRLILGHGLVLTVIGLGIPGLVGGSVIIEAVYSIPGMGRYYLSSIQQLDFPVVQAINLVSALVVLFGNLVVDISYSWLNPRIRYS